MALTISYIDPGYGVGIDGVTCVESEEYNPINGVAYTKEGGGVINLPTSAVFFNSIETQRTYNVTLRFSVYINSINSAFTASFSDAEIGNLNIIDSGFYNVALFKSAYIVRITSPSNGFEVRRQIRKVDIDSNISTTIMGNVRTVSTFSQAVLHAFGSSLSFIFPSEGICYISNVIVSYESFDLATNSVTALSSGSFPVKLPLKNTSGDFISLGGEYVGNSAGQKLLSVVDAQDAQDVITKFGATSKVSHLVTYGYPGYRVGANITSATGISQSGNDSITAHGSCNLSTDANASACVAWAVDNTKLSDVDGMKIGWQV